MFRKLTLPYLILILLATAGLWIYIGRPDCAAACAQQGVIVAGLLLAGAAVLIAYLVARDWTHPLQTLTQLAHQLRAGQTHSHVFAKRQDELGQLIHAFNDMTEHFHHKIAALIQERQQSARVLAHMADGILFVDAAGRITSLNQAAARILDTVEAEAVGRSVAEVVRHHELIALWQRCQTQGEEQIAAIEIGGELFLQTIITPFRENDVPGYLISLQDLTAIRHLQMMRRDFISNISHELRTPLASLRAVVETLQDGALDDPPAAQRFLERADLEVDTLTQMVEELLELSRIESGQVPLKLEKTAVADLVLNPMERLRPQAERNEIELVLDLSLGLPLVLADASRVQQVVANLLHNAIKFSASGDQVVVQAHVSESGTAVLFSVKDNGIGIPAVDLPRIFERFYKSDRSRTRGEGGTGLGLAIARHIIQAHNGRIWAKSKEGKGSTFYFTLPVAE